MRVSVCLGAILIPEYLDFRSGYSTPRSRIAGIYSGIYSGINSYSGISQTNAPSGFSPSKAAESFKSNYMLQQFPKEMYNPNNDSNILLYFNPCMDVSK